MIKTMIHNPKKLPKILTKWLKKSFLDKIISLGNFVICATSLSSRSAEKAWPSVLYETVKLDVVFVEEKVVCRAVSSLVVTVDWKGHAVNFKRKTPYTCIWQKHCWKNENNGQCKLVAQWKKMIKLCNFINWKMI